MIEHVKQHWKVIVICLLVAVIVFMLYRHGKLLQETKQPPTNKAVGKTDEPAKHVEKVENPIEKPVQASCNKVFNANREVIPEVNCNKVLAQYRAGGVKLDEALNITGLKRTAFYNRLRKYDQANAFQRNSSNA